MTSQIFRSRPWSYLRNVKFSDKFIELIISLLAKIWLTWNNWLGQTLILSTATRKKFHKIDTRRTKWRHEWELCQLVVIFWLQCAWVLEWQGFTLIKLSFFITGLVAKYAWVFVPLKLYNINWVVVSTTYKLPIK